MYPSLKLKLMNKNVNHAMLLVLQCLGLWMTHLYLTAKKKAVSYSLNYL